MDYEEARNVVRVEWYRQAGDLRRTNGISFAEKFGFRVDSPRTD